MRIFIKNIKEQIELNKEQKNYIKKVMRKTDGFKLKVFNESEEYEAELKENSLIRKELIRKAEPAQKVKLAVCSIKKHRLEWLIEKATEIGADEITILKSERTQFEYKNIERLEKIALEATEQSNRMSLVKIKKQNLKEFLKEADENWVCASLEEKVEENKENKEFKASGIVIGPEGGWSAKEEKELNKLNKIKLSENVLRTETAAIVGLSLLKSFF